MECLLFTAVMFEVNLKIEECLDLGGVFGFEAAFFTFEEADPHFAPPELLSKFFLGPAFGLSGRFDSGAAQSNGWFAAGCAAGTGGGGF